MAETLDLVSIALETWVKAQFTSAALVFQNVPYTPVAGTPWVRFTVLPATFPRLVMTGSRDTGHQLVGFATAQIFVPLNEGTGGLRRLCDEMRDVLAERHLAVEAGKTLSLGPAEIQVVGGSGNWFQGNVTARFEYLET